MNHAVLVLLTITFAALPGTASAGAGKEKAIPWLTDPSQALERARREGRPIVADFWAEWCRPCMIMEKTTYQDPEVIEALHEFVPLKINADENHGFTVRNRVHAFPTTMVLDHAGTEITRWTGLMRASELEELLDRVREGYQWYLHNVGRDEDPEAMMAMAVFLQTVGNPQRAVKLLRRCRKLIQGADRILIQEVELRLAEARLAAGEAATAARVLNRLSREGENDSIRARALASLVLAERRLGRTKRVDEALERLRRRYPYLVGNP